jgi:hypothetical protein
MRPPSFKEFCAEQDRAENAPAVVVEEEIVEEAPLDPRLVEHPMKPGENKLTGQRFGKLVPCLKNLFREIGNLRCLEVTME